MQSDIQNNISKFVFQVKRVYTFTKQLRHDMESLRDTFQLRLVAGRSHCHLCCCYLSSTYKPQL
jgi:hypothetical protein